MGKIKRTKIQNVFRSEKMAFDIDYPRFMKEVIENSDQKMFAKCWDIYLWFMQAIAQRATELNDDVLNALMIRMNMYEVPLKERCNILKRLEKQYKYKKKK